MNNIGLPDSADSAVDIADVVFFVYMQNSGEESVANIDMLRHSNGSTPTADLRIKMQKVGGSDMSLIKTLLPFVESSSTLQSCSCCVSSHICQMVVKVIAMSFI